MFAESVEKRAEVRKVRDIRHQRLYACCELPLRGAAALVQPLFDLLGDFNEHLDELCYVASCVVDVRLQQHTVSRSLVELDVILGGQHVLELRSIEAR